MTQEQKIISKLYEAKKVELGTHKVDLTISNDIDKFIDNATTRVTDANEMIKKAIVEYGIALNGFKQAISMSENAIKTSKDLGVDSKFFEGRLNIAKTLMAKAEKNKNLNVQY